MEWRLVLVIQSYLSVLSLHFSYSYGINIVVDVEKNHFVKQIKVNDRHHHHHPHAKVHSIEERKHERRKFSDRQITVECIVYEFMFGNWLKFSSAELEKVHVWLKKRRFDGREIDQNNKKKLVEWVAKKELLDACLSELQ